VHTILQENEHDAHQRKVKEEHKASEIPATHDSVSQSEHLRAALEEGDAYRARIPEARRLVYSNIRNAKDLKWNTSENAILDFLDGTEPCEPASVLNPRD
jgi:hypothetical protein